MNRRQRARLHLRRKAHSSPYESGAFTNAANAAAANDRREQAITNMENMTVAALIDWATSLDISVKKKWRKRELIDHIATEIRKQPLKVEA